MRPCLSCRRNAVLVTLLVSFCCVYLLIFTKSQPPLNYKPDTSSEHSHGADQIIPGPSPDEKKKDGEDLSDFYENLHKELVEEQLEKLQKEKDAGWERAEESVRADAARPPVDRPVHLPGLAYEEEHTTVSADLGLEKLKVPAQFINRYAEFGDPSNFQCDEGLCWINGRAVKEPLIKETPADMFTFLPPEDEFLTEFRNPCWKAPDGTGTERLFCIPYFYIIGVTKCGTTDMFSILKNHAMVSSRSRKESHYIDRARRGRSLRMNRLPDKLALSFTAWTNTGKFRTNLLETYSYKEGDPILFPGITMDATPSHSWDNEYWELFHQGYREPPVTNPDLIATLYPKTKIILSLRDPIKRMQSAYQFFCAYNVYKCDKPVTPEKFHGLVVDALDSFAQCRTSNTVRGCVYSTSTHQLATHLYASIYSVYLADWLAAFPREQVHVIKFEDHIANQPDSFVEICKFLEIEPFDKDRLSQYIESHKVRNSLNDNKRIPYMLPETVEMLEDFFAPFLGDLVTMLGDEKWSWGRPVEQREGDNYQLGGEGER